MATAFQANAFQNDAFQIDGGVTPPVVTTPAVGGIARKPGRRRHRWEVQIGDEVFEVSGPDEARRLLLEAREQAKLTAANAAEQALAKAANKTKPAAIERAFAAPAPKVRLLETDYADPQTQQIVAAVDAAHADINATYVRIFRAARERYEREQDEEETIQMMLQVLNDQ